MAKGDMWRNLAKLLVGVGGVNWGLVEFFDVNLVTQIAGATNAVVAPITYGAVAVSGLATLGMIKLGRMTTNQRIAKMLS